MTDDLRGLVVWEGDESEGRWRCLLCGETREGEDDTGPEGVEHLADCESGPPWALVKLAGQADHIAALEWELQEWHREMAEAANDKRHFTHERNGIRMALAGAHAKPAIAVALAAAEKPDD